MPIAKAEVLDSEVAIQKQELDAKEQQKQSHDIESIKRDLTETQRVRLITIVSLLIYYS